MLFGCLLLPAVFAAGAVNSHLENTSHDAQATRVLVLGDSISAAYGMSLEQGWVALLQERLRDEYPSLQMINGSISGETTVGGLQRLPALLSQHQPSLVIIELGGNDGLRGYPIKTLRENLRQLVALSQAAGARVILLPMQIPPNYGSRYTQAFYNSYKLVAEETGSHLGNFILDQVALDMQLMQPDGIHPTAAAQPKLADAVEKPLRQLLEGL